MIAQELYRSGFRALLGVALTLSAAQLAISDEAVPDGEAEEFSLRYQFSPNQFLRYKVTHNSEITTQFNAATDQTTNETVTRKHLRVTSVAEDGTAVVEPVLDQVQMTAKFSGKPEVRFDSNWDENKIPANFKDTKKIVGKPLARVRVNSRGEFLSVKRLESTTKGGAAQETPDNDPSRNFLIVFPEKPVKIGDSWTDKFKSHVSINKEVQREVELLRTYRLTAVENDIAVISMVTSVVAPIRVPAIRVQLIQREPSGEVRFDLQRGMIVSRTLSVDKTVLDCFGPQSSMRAKSDRKEVLEDAQVAQKP